ncbi:MAG: hypothetical protein HQ481_05835 [Alphaproteobacteria bacterium]|nr:hypothetical protein [Alphaproteobacteria bacterium]
MNGSSHALVPTDVADRLRWALSAIDEGNLSRGEEALRSLARLSGTTRVAIVNFFEGYAEDPESLSWKLLIRTALISIRLDLLELAERALEHLVERPIELANVYSDALTCSLRCARLDLAANFLDKLSTKFPDDPLTHARTGDYRFARQRLAEIVALEPDASDPDVPEADAEKDPRIDLGHALARGGRSAEAIEWLIAAGAADRGGESFWWLADAFEALGQRDVSARLCRRLFEREPSTKAMEKIGDFHLAEGSPQAAVRSYGYCSYQDMHDVEVRRKLASATGRVWRDRLSYPGWLRGSDRPRYFDCFMFNGEFDLLALRLAALSNHVEKFIVVEAAKTFTGQPKPLMFKENMHLFADYADKIVYVPVEDFPTYCEHPWAKDFYQRDAMVMGLDGIAADDDYVVIADADELWNWEVVKVFNGELATMRMRLAKHFLNYQPIGTGWANRDTAAITRYRHVRENGASAVRFNLSRLQRKLRGVWLDDAGWHFHAMGDERFIQYKFLSYAHREHHNKPELVVEDRVRARLDRIRAGGYERGWVATPVAHSLPPEVTRDPSAFQHLLLKPEVDSASDWIRRLVYDRSRV